jgi:hypothetical protein
MNQQNPAKEVHPRAPAIPTETRGRSSNGASTGEMLVAVARDTLDVATELVRDGVALGRLEVERAARDVAPRIVWGAVAIVCAATASVCAVIAIMIGLGTFVPSIAWRLVILAAALFLVAFFGSVRAWRPEPRSISMTTKEEPIRESPPNETWMSRRSERLTSTILPPPNA